MICVIIANQSLICHFSYLPCKCAILIHVLTICWCRHGPQGLQRAHIAFLKCFIMFIQFCSVPAITNTNVQCDVASYGWVEVFFKLCIICDKNSMNSLNFCMYLLNKYNLFIIQNLIANPANGLLALCNRNFGFICVTICVSIEHSGIHCDHHFEF